MELHRKREPGQDVQIAIDEFLSIARGLETYGIDPHPVKDHRGTQIYLGINYTGISTFAIGKRVQHFRWPEVHKLNYEGKMFIAHLSYTDRESREPVGIYKFYISCHLDNFPRNFNVLLYIFLFYCRKSIRLVLNVQREPIADMCGVVLSNKCSFSRKSILASVSSIKKKI